MNYVKSDVNESGFISFIYPFMELQFAYYNFLSDIYRAFFTSLNTKYLFWHLYFPFFVALPFIFYAEYTSEFE